MTLAPPLARSRLADVSLPDFGMPDAMPTIPDALYVERVERLRARADARGYDRLVVYADREHSANLAYLTRFDPRFEEAILVLGPTGEPAILVGNECWGMAGAAPLPIAVTSTSISACPCSHATARAPCARSSATRGSRRAGGSASSAGRPTASAR